MQHMHYLFVWTCRANDIAAAATAALQAMGMTSQGLCPGLP